MANVGGGIIDSIATHTWNHAQVVTIHRMDTKNKLEKSAKLNIHWS